ncbi:MAG: site-specific integrase [Nevskia sp.]|nr:site-specific integrase [Nevskia sp.]
MTTPPPSRTPSEPTLATLRDQIRADPALPPRRRQDLLSALNTVSRALGRPIGDIPAHPDFLRRHLAGLTPVAAGVSAGRLANVHSLLQAALELGGLAQMPGRYVEPMVPEWEAIFRLLPTSQHRFGLSRFCHDCSRRHIPPDQVTDAVMTDFAQDLEASLVDHPHAVHRLACRLWNRAAETIPAWPKQRLQVPSYTDTYAIPWEDLPPTLRTDCEAYLARLAGSDPLEALDFRPLRPSSIRTRKRQLGELVSAMLHNGVAAEALQSLADVVQLDRVKAGLRFLLERNSEASGPGASSPPTTQAYQLAQLATAIAYHWVGVPAPDLAALTALRRHLSPRKVGLRETNRVRLRQFDDPAAVARFVTMPQRIRDRFRALKRPARKDALTLQLGVAVALLQALPMRISNLAALRIGTHLLSSGRGGWHLAVSGEEVKNGTDLEAVLPDDACQILDLYLHRARPLLTNVPTDALFPGRYGPPKSVDMLREQIEKGVAAWTGLTVHPHLFRHILAKLYLEAHPGQYGVVKLLLGHKSIDTTMTNYCGTETASALQHFDRHMQALRAAAPMRVGGGRS